MKEFISDNEFVQFDTKEECNEFILYISIMNIKIGHRCC
jgi:hypothetical protein